MDFNLNNEKNSTNVILEAANFFADQGYSVLNNGYAEIASSPKLSESYIDALLEGVENANNRAEMKALMENTTNNILVESLGSINGLSSLSMPVIRKLWPKVVAKEALKTKVAAAPIFTIAYQKPYLSRLTEKGEERIELPRGAFKHDENATDNKETFGVAFNDGRKLNATLTIANPNSTGLNAFSHLRLYGGEDASDDVMTAEKAKAPLDRNITLESVTFVPAVGDKKTVYFGKKLALEPVMIEDFVVSENKKAQIIVKANFEKSSIEAAVLGTASDFDAQALTVEISAYKSSEWNETGWDVNFGINRQEITIGTGDHLNAPISVEYLQDVQALYNINAAAEIADLMTNTFAQKVDYEIIDFMLDCFIKRPRNNAFPAGDGYKGIGAHAYTFDCLPAAGFAGGPSAWRAELKTVINTAAINVMRETYLQSGTFVIMGNPLDTQLLQNIDWQYKGGAGGNVDGVDVNYEMGVYQSSTFVYKVISTLNFEPGKLLLTFIPSGDKQICQVYYPYSFRIEKGNGYRSPNHSLVPSIMMTKRHTMHEFMPSTAVIVIQNNDGRGHFHKGNVFDNEFASAKKTE